MSLFVRVAFLCEWEVIGSISPHGSILWGSSRIACQKVLWHSGVIL